MTKAKVAETGMGVLDFIASLVGSLAWPLAAIIIAAIFHRQIGALLAKIRKLNWGDASVELSEQLDKVEDKVRAIEAQAPQPVLPPPAQGAPDDRFQALLAISPSAAILDAWKPVERRLVSLGKEHFGPGQKYTPLPKIAEKLAGTGVLMSSVVGMVEDLRKIRNDASHSKEVSVTDALRFNELAIQVMGLLADQQ